MAKSCRGHNAHREKREEVKKQLVAKTAAIMAEGSAQPGLTIPVFNLTPPSSTDEQEEGYTVVGSKRKWPAK